MEIALDIEAIEQQQALLVGSDGFAFVLLVCDGRALGENLCAQIGSAKSVTEPVAKAAGVNVKTWREMTLR